MSAAAAASAFREIGPQRIPELEQLLCLLIRCGLHHDMNDAKDGPLRFLVENDWNVFIDPFRDGVRDWLGRAEIDTPRSV